jgi:glyoxylase-like metal-dependent hydrolase (beta-lactamase superfamily II)
VVSHIDADHIGGVIELLEDTALGVSFGDIWFNGYRHLPAPKAPAAPPRESASPSSCAPAASPGTSPSTATP